MKIAICISGMLGNNNKYGVGQSTSELAITAASYFFKNIINNNSNVDVFCHSWNPEFEQQIKSLYQPKGSVFQKQKNFGPHLDLRQFSITSRWFSNKLVIEEMNRYEKKHDFEYDFVMLTRFDIAFLKPIDFRLLNKEKFYIMGTDPIHKNKGIHSVPDHSCCDIQSDNYEINDLWFIANSKNMSIFSKTYDNLDTLGLDSNHRIARRHLQTSGLFEQRAFILEQNVHGLCNETEGDSPLVRWLHPIE